MAAPVVVGILGQALIQAVIKPWPWLTLLGFVTIVRFNPASFTKETVNIIWGLWPFVVLIVILWQSRNFVYIYREILRIKKKP